MVAQPAGWAFVWWGTGLYWVAGVLYAVQVRDAGPRGEGGGTVSAQGRAASTTRRPDESMTLIT